MSRSKMTRLTLGAVGPAPTSGPPVISVLFNDFKPNNRIEYIDIGEDLGGFGNLGHPADLTRQNVRRVTPSGKFKPSVGELFEFLPWIFNAAGVGSPSKVFSPGNSALFRMVEYTDSTGVIHSLRDCAVAKAAFAATAGRELTLETEMIGVDWNEWATSTYPPWGNTTRFLFGDTSVRMDGILAPCRSFRIEIDHGLRGDRFYYGFTTATPINLDRKVMLQMEIPYGLFAAARFAGEKEGGVAVSFALDAIVGADTVSLRFDLPAARWPTSSPDATIPDEQMITVQAQCFIPAVPGAGGVPVPFAGAEITATVTPLTPAPAPATLQAYIPVRAREALHQP